MIKIKTVVLADDHPIIIGGLKQCLTESGEFKVVGEACNYTELKSTLSVAVPDITIVDIVMPEAKGGKSLESLLKKYGDRTKFVVYTSFDDDIALFIRLKNLGLKGYLLKIRSIEEVMRTLHAIVERGIVKYDTRVMERYFNYEQENKISTQHEFSQREKEIITLICKSYDTNHIIKELGIEESTYRSHRKRIYKKANIHKVMQLVEVARKLGLIDE